MRNHTYGQRGGEGPNTGKKATIYEATLPDNRVVRKRSYNIHDDFAWFHVYKVNNEGDWQFCGPFTDKTNWPNGIYVIAQKVN